MKNSSRSAERNYKKQSGSALIIFVLIILLASTSLLFKVMDSNTIKIERDKKTAAALAEAKAALIGWSVNSTNSGQFPCPENTMLIGQPYEGQAQSSCNSSLPVVGRLPWRTLGTVDLRDGYGEKLWYVLSPGFRTTPINLNSSAQLSVDSNSGIVAIVIAPGPPLTGQSRLIPTASAPPNVIQYLDLSNNDNNFSFSSHGTVSTFNDNLIVIKATELFSILTIRVLNEIRGNATHGIKEYFSTFSKFPYADNQGDGHADAGILSGTPSYQGHPDSLFFSPTLKNMLINNGWFPLTTYQVSTDQQTVVLMLNGKTLVVNP